MQSLTAQIEQLLEEQKAEKRRSKEEALQWNREKSKMLELFSNRLDVMHSHQTSTLQELQMARQEIGKVQEILMISPHEQQEAAEENENSENKGLTAQQKTVACSDAGHPLEGASARLEELKESLYQREREITDLLEAERSPVPPVPRPPCSVLLPTVIQKAHAICGAVAETRVLLDQMIEDNRIALTEARDKLSRLRNAREDGDKATDQEGSDKYDSSLSVLQETVREYEVCQIALDCIKSGDNPAINGKYTV
ncbi:uncharacterized protein [Leuresthes tenuis]|uniref:uncharacterized protein n=1 Tax=Leuresthes tenuis TaxID=355514 RepID=UPI003B512265